MKNTLKVLCILATLAAANALLADGKREPTGLYDLVFGTGGKPADLTNNPCLTNPNVDGFRYKAGWKAIQPNSETGYNWRSIDAAIAIAAQYGKKLSISIAAGTSTPDWVYTSSPVVYKYAMIETDPKTGLSVGNQPLPWDMAFQTKWLKFVAAFGARYDSNPACSYVPLGGFMEDFPMTLVKIPADDAAVNALAQNPPPGYTGLTTSYTDSSAAYVPAAQMIIAAFMNAFPTTPVILTLGSPFPTDAGLANQTTIKNWGIATYPGRFGTMVSALYATVPPHGPPPYPLLTYPKGFQMVCQASDAARLYLDPDPVPIPAAPIPLQDALEHGVTLGGKYVEVYQPDLVASGAQSMLAIERAKLQANAP